MKFYLISNIPNLTNPEGEANAGGINRLRLIPAGMVDFIQPERFAPLARQGYPDYTMGGMALLVKTFGHVTDIAVLPEYGSFTEDMDMDMNGEFFRPIIQVIIPKVRPDLVSWIHRFRAVDWVAIIRDRNGLCRVAGTPDQPVKLTTSQSHGAGKGRNQTVFTFTAAVKQPAYFTAGIEDVDLFNPGPFDQSFGFSFDA